MHSIMVTLIPAVRNISLQNHVLASQSVGDQGTFTRVQQGSQDDAIQKRTCRSAGEAIHRHIYELPFAEFLRTPRSCHLISGRSRMSVFTCPIQKLFPISTITCVRKISFSLEGLLRSHLNHTSFVRSHFALSIVRPCASYSIVSNRNPGILFARGTNGTDHLDDKVSALFPVLVKRLFFTSPRNPKNWEFPE